MISKSEKAYNQGKKDFRRGVTRNPYIWLGGKYQHLASWWDKGYNEEAKRDSELCHTRHQQTY